VFTAASLCITVVLLLSCFVVFPSRCWSEVTHGTLVVFNRLLHKLVRDLKTMLDALQGSCWVGAMADSRTLGPPGVYR
jgi:hypothetical protein